MSLAYMALISNTDVYQDLRERGASRQDAAVVALGSTAGMYAVDKYAHLGELFFDDLTADSTRSLRATTKKTVQEWHNFLTEGIHEADNPSKLGKLLDKGKKLGKKIVNQYVEDLKYHSTGFFGKAIGEGIEEVAEEVVTDLSKSLY
jgi:hypothetical protein